MATGRGIEWEFIRAAVVPREGAHAAGSVQRAAELLADHPELAGASIHTAAILGDLPTVRRFIERDPASATAKGGPYEWDPLTHLAFSNFLKADAAGPERPAEFAETAEALLAAGASANAGFYEPGHEPTPTFESVLYGAAGVAHHPAVTAVLLAHGADPNDDEVPYHVGESYDNRAVQVLVESGKLTADSLGMILIRKCDWHDADGVRYLLERGVDPNHCRRWNTTALHHALKRDNRIEIVTMLLDHGSDPLIVEDGANCIQLAVRIGRTDALDLFSARGIRFELTGADLLLHALAYGATDRVQALAAEHPEWVRAVMADGGRYLALWSLHDNINGVRALLDLGVPATATFPEGYGYFGIPRHAPALHVAAWLARHDVVELLIARGADVNAVVTQGYRQVTALTLAVRAATDSYWTRRRSPRSVQALLAAGASRAGVQVPCGYDEVDRLLESH